MLQSRTVDGGTPDIQIMELDLLQPGSIDKFASEFTQKFKQLDILINNAGTNIPGISEGGLDYVFTVSYLGHWYLTTKLYDAIKDTPNARVVNLTSVLHRYGSTQWWDAATGKRGSDSYFNALTHVYCDSKLAMMLFTQELRQRFEKDGSSAMAFAVAPGNVKTDIWRAVPLPLRIPLDPFMRLAFLSTDEGCHTSVTAALGPLEDLGGKNDPALYLQPYRGPTNRRPFDVTGLFGGTIPTIASLPPNVEAECTNLWEMSARLIEKAKEGALPFSHAESH
jgi:NAD(P)-dependent dehydrogenase (short-subunit alcohol dehydrogenase family)